MKRKIITTVATVILAAGGVFAAGNQAKPKITMAQARETAIKTAPGKVKSAELETEHGKLIYSFDIATSKNALTEVNVDAINGKVIAVQHENAAKESAEQKQETKDKEARH